MLRVGLTGGIGAGKSFVAQLFENKGVPIYRSDDRAKWLMQHDLDLKQKLTATFSDAVYQNGTLNRTFLAEQVFNQPEKLQLLNALVHPAVARDTLAWNENYLEHPLVIKEAAILIESGAYKQVDKIIVVEAPLDIKCQRVMQRDSCTKEDFLKRVQNQLSDTDRRVFADYIIVNDNIADVAKQVDDIYNALLALHAEGGF